VKPSQAAKAVGVLLSRGHLNFDGTHLFLVDK
jgi:hypothetical protein